MGVGPAMSWSRFVIPGTCTICELFCTHGYREAGRGGDEPPGSTIASFLQRSTVFEASQIFRPLRAGVVSRRSSQCRERRQAGIAAGGAGHGCIRRPIRFRHRGWHPDGSSAGRSNNSQRNEQGKNDGRCWSAARAETSSERSWSSRSLCTNTCSAHTLLACGRQDVGLMHSVWLRYHERSSLCGAHHYHVWRWHLSSSAGAKKAAHARIAGSAGTRDSQGRRTGTCHLSTADYN